MNVTELHAHLQEIIDGGNGDMTVLVQAMTGGLRGTGNVNIKSVFYGFDWDHGKILIQPEQTLLGAAYAEKRREAARKEGEREALKGKKK
jgi:hypothetical protein